MTTFNKKPPQIEAVQFTGGLESAIEIISWLHVRHAESSYVPEILNDGEIEVTERVLVNAHCRSFFIIGVGEWVVYDPAGERKLYTLDTEWLEQEYEVAPGG